MKKKILLLGKYIKKSSLEISIFNFLKKKKYKVYFANEFEKFNAKKYDLVVSYGYGKIINKNQIKKLNCNIINLHIGYLPFARGIYPLVWSLVFFKPIGISIHIINDEKIDSGPLIYRKKLKYKMKDTLKIIHLNCRKMIEKYFFENIDKLFKININKIRNKNKSNYYFDKENSKKLMIELPNKWDTTASYIKSNSRSLRKIYRNK